MFKRIFIQKPEPLLIVVPLILFLLYKAFYGSSALDIHQQESFMQLGNSNIFWILFWFVIFPLQLHFLLRTSGKWEPAVCRVHVYVTVSLLIILFLLFFIHLHAGAGAPRRYFSYSNIADRFNTAWYNSKPAVLVFILGFLVQLVFTVYFLRTIFKKAA